jgi:hypothetical protein
MDFGSLASTGVVANFNIICATDASGPYLVTQNGNCGTPDEGGKIHGATQDFQIDASGNIKTV